MKTFVLTVSITFPATHKRKGEPTNFPEKILLGVGCPNCETIQDLTGLNVSSCNSCHTHAMLDPKLHTIRSSYEMWANRIKQVQEGKAILSIRYWSGKPYNSKQIEICKLDKSSGCGVQKLEFLPKGFEANPVINGWFGDKETYSFEELFKNDGLSPEDFKEWFKNYDLSDPMAIIHFTKFRY